MKASTFVGRIGLLAGTLGVGAALFGGAGIAGADLTSPDTTGPGAPTNPAGSQSASAQASDTPRGSVTRSARTPRSSVATNPRPFPRTARDTPVIAEADVPAVEERAAVPRRGSDLGESAVQPPAADVSPRPAAATAGVDARSLPTPADDAPRQAPVDAPAPAAAPAAALSASTAPQSLTALIGSAATAVATTQAVATQVSTPAVGVPTTLATVAQRISTAVNSVITGLVGTFFSNSPFAPQVDGPANWLLLAVARRQPLAAATGSAQVSTPAAPTLLVLDGYDVVPTTVETISAITGRFTYWPGMPNMVQGSQELDLVDPSTEKTVGSFTALVTSGDPTSLGSRYVQLLVTDNDGTNVGTGAGQVPPVGSMISSLSWGLLRLSYTAMPTASADKVSVKLRTLFGNIALPISYDAAAGIADGTFDNRPTVLGGGFSIVPAKPAGEKITATIGLPPLFNSVQGRQVFDIVDSEGTAVGSFEGAFTTTSDVINISTQAILVTANDGRNVGTQPGQTPPVGTVYNVAYFGNDDVYLLYSSMPQKSGDVITITLTTPFGTVDLPPGLFKSFNASTEPVIKSLTAPGGQKFVATSTQLPAGVNGLPPRDVQTQGYQQFEVFDFLGRKIGSVDADVASQWDGFGVHSKSLLITNVTAGKTGSTPFEVPPVGSVLNFIFFNGGFGLTDTVMALPGVNLNALNIVTPLGMIPLLPLPVPVGTRPPVVYANPFKV